MCMEPVVYCLSSGYKTMAFSSITSPSVGGCQRRMVPPIRRPNLAFVAWWKPYKAKCLMHQDIHVCALYPSIQRSTGNMHSAKYSGLDFKIPPLASDPK